MGYGNDAGVIRFSVFTNFLHHRSDDPFVGEFDVLEPFKAANIVGCNERHTIDAHLGTVFFVLIRFFHNLMDLTSDVNIGCLSKPLNCFESIAGIMVTWNNQDWSNLTEFDDVFVTELLDRR